MAARNFPSNKLYNGHVMLVQLDGIISIGASGAPTIQAAPFIQSITRLAAGIYQLQLQDNYNGAIDLQGDFQSSLSGSPVAAGSFVVGKAYSITVVGSTSWSAIGLPSGVSPVVGSVFVATGVGSGSGTATLVGNSGIRKIEQIGLLQSNQPFVAPLGGYLMLQCLADTSAADPTMIPADPANGSIMHLKLLLNNSSVQ